MKKQGWILIAITVIFICLFAGIFLWRFLDRTDTVTPGTMNRPTKNASATVEIVNINTATVQELQQLPGIGPVLAQRIIDYRTEHGDFTKTEQLMEVKGIGETTFMELAPYVTIGG